MNNKLQEAMNDYEERIKKILPIEQKIKELERKGLSLEEIKKTLGDSYIFNYVPELLYHGSLENLDVINSRESTQKGSYVYATDNPIHALFFAIFRNSSIARAHINEYIDDIGNYHVKYCIDERVLGALKEIILDKYVTIYVCDGKQFFKPQGEAYIRREWVSKDGKSIVPIDKIEVNVKQFFEDLEKKGLVKYDRYDKEKDWQTVIDMVGQNYPFGLGTEKGQNIQEFDAMYDEFIGSYFKEQLEFSKHLREFVKRVMNTKLDCGMSLEEENDYKLRYIRNFVRSFLVSEIKDNGKIVWHGNMDKINDFMNMKVEDQNQIIK